MRTKQERIVENKGKGKRERDEEERGERGKTRRVDDKRRHGE